MTVLASLNSQSFGVQSRDIPFSVNANVTLMRVTFTHPDWPSVGPVLQCELFWDGVSSGLFQTFGGVVLNKAGIPTGGTAETTLQVAKPPGLTNGVVRVKVMQTFTSAILVESF